MIWRIMGAVTQRTISFVTPIGHLTFPSYRLLKKKRFRHQNNDSFFISSILHVSPKHRRHGQHSTVVCKGAGYTGFWRFFSLQVKVSGQWTSRKPRTWLIEGKREGQHNTTLPEEAVKANCRNFTAIALVVVVGTTFAPWWWQVAAILVPGLRRQLWKETRMLYVTSLLRMSLATESSCYPADSSSEKKITRKVDT